MSKKTYLFAFFLGSWLIIYDLVIPEADSFKPGDIPKSCNFLKEACISQDGDCLGRLTQLMVSDRFIDFPLLCRKSWLEC